MRKRAVVWTAAMVAVALGLTFGAPAAVAAGKGHAYGRTKHDSTSSSDSSRGNSSKATSDHEGDAESSSTSYTEDNDTNDGGTPNNQPDAGDNRHPSGKDRSVEYGNSGNQGNSASDPDDDGKGPDRSNGGPDKPNGSGGIDKADQDGNNGCGNDDDFEDDNEGWCGQHPKPQHDVCAQADASEMPPGLAKKCDVSASTEDSPSRDTTGTESSGEASAAVGGKALATAATGSRAAQVLGTRIVRGSIPASVAAAATSGRLTAGAPLAFTGWNTALFVVMALVLIVLGTAVVTGARKRT